MKNKILKITQLTSIQTGYTFRSRLEAMENGSVSVIQMKDLLSNNTVDCGKCIKTDMKTVRDHHLAQKGDLIFRSRGLVTTSAILLTNPHKTIVSAPLLRIRITNTKIILPEYLNWYISQKDAQRYFTSRQEGSSINMISQKQLEELPVPIPSLAEQKQILEINELHNQEIDALNKLIKIKKIVVAQLLGEFAKGDKT